MTSRDIVVIGASAGGIEALQQLVQTIPADLGTTILTVVHIPPRSPSALPMILSKGSLPAVHPLPEQKMESGRIYVAPPDRHMIVDDGHLRLWRGPKENRHQPAINALFRSAAVNYRERVVGVILSGALDDGTTGLWWVKHYGGVTVVQDPAEARFPDMVHSAMEHVEVDYMASASEMGPLLAGLAAGTVQPAEVGPIWKRSRL